MGINVSQIQRKFRWTRLHCKEIVWILGRSNWLLGLLKTGLGRILQWHHEFLVIRAGRLSLHFNSIYLLLFWRVIFNNLRHTISGVAINNFNSSCQSVICTLLLIIGIIHIECSFEFNNFLSKYHIFFSQSSFCSSGRFIRITIALNRQLVEQEILVLHHYLRIISNWYFNRITLSPSMTIVN